MRKLSAYILLLSLAGSSAEAATYTWYGSPFKEPDAHFSTPWLSSVDMAINDWWGRYQARWASAFPGCFYVRTDYGDGAETGVFGAVKLKGRCGGGNPVIGTRYTSDIPPDDPKGNGSSCLSSPNPIAYGNGNKWLVEEDIVANEGVLGFERAYNSNPVTIGGNFGARWRSDYGQQLVFARAGGAGKIWTYRPDGKVIKHTLTSGVYLPDADIADRLYTDASSGGAYRLHTGDGFTVKRKGCKGPIIFRL